MVDAPMALSRLLSANLALAQHRSRIVGLQTGSIESTKSWRTLSHGLRPLTPSAIARRKPSSATDMWDTESQPKSFPYYWSVQRDSQHGFTSRKSAVRPLAPARKLIWGIVNFLIKKEGEAGLGGIAELRRRA